MPDIPTTAQLSDFESERRLLHRLAAHTRDEDPQVIRTGMEILGSSGDIAMSIDRLSAKL